MDKEKQAQAEIQEILKKYNLKVSYSLTFPIYRILPDEVKLAMNILFKHGLKISFILKEKE